jgi:hypothetical protein
VQSPKSYCATRDHSHTRRVRARAHDTHIAAVDVALSVASAIAPQTHCAHALRVARQIVTRNRRALPCYTASCCTHSRSRPARLRWIATCPRCTRDTQARTDRRQSGNREREHDPNTTTRQCTSLLTQPVPVPPGHSSSTRQNGSRMPLRVRDHTQTHEHARAITHMWACARDPSHTHSNTPASIALAHEIAHARAMAVTVARTSEP